MRAAVGVLCALALASCGGRKARSYAVTLLDSASLECSGSAEGLLGDPAELEEIAGSLRKAWKLAAESNPLRPEPRLLRVNELETRMQGWFDATSASSGWDNWPSDAGAGGAGNPPTEDVGAGGGTADASTDPWFAYGAPATLYQGELHDDYVEGSFALTFDTDAADEEAGRYPCGPRARAMGTLSLTRVEGVQGRIRWIRSIWIGSEFSACEGRVDCARSILVEGLEIE
jgi:hypothetical protein